MVEELKAVFDPTFHGWDKGKPVPSLAAAIGNVIQRHMDRIGYGAPIPTNEVEFDDADMASAAEWERTSGPPKTGGRICPTCFSTNLKMESGCFQCLDCGNSKCG